MPLSNISQWHIKSVERWYDYVISCGLTRVHVSQNNSGWMRMSEACILSQNQQSESTYS